MGEKAQIEARSRTWEITSREIALLYSNLVKSPKALELVLHEYDQVPKIPLIFLSLHCPALS